MSSKKFIILALLASIFIHTLVLSLTGLIDMSGTRRNQAPLMVTLKEPVENKPDQAQESSSPQADAAAPTVPADALPTPREETVALSNPDSPYTPYLLKIKHRIDQRWVYPPEAASRRQEGETVIRFSVATGGGLAETAVLASSGSVLLDQAAMDVIRTSAPFAPLPRALRLDRLHIVARFQYHLGE